MNDKAFTICCSFITFTLSLLSSYIMVKINHGRKLKEEKYNDFYKKFYILWDKIHQGRAFDFFDLEFSDRERIIDFLLENYNYAPQELQELIYELKTNRLDNYDSNNKDNIEKCNYCYRKILEYMVNKEEKHRKKFVNIKF